MNILYKLLLKSKKLNKQRRRYELNILNKTPYFDKEYYLINNKDVLKAKIDPIVHYLDYGYREGRDPSPLFSTNDYYELNPDVLESGMNPLIHYVLYGKRENRLKFNLSNKPSPENESQSLNIDFEKMIFFDLRSMLNIMSVLGASIYNLDKDFDYENVVFIFSHEMNLTGAPIALERMAISIKNNGFQPIIISAFDGPLSKRYGKHSIPVVIYEDLCNNNLIDYFFDIAEFIVVNTAESFSIINKLNGTAYKTIWWIHECSAAYTNDLISVLPDNISNNIFPYCVGWYALDALKKVKQSYDLKELLYGLPELKTETSRKNHDFITFACVGTLSIRKGQEVLINAIRILPKNVLSTLRFVFVGSIEDEDIYKTLLELEDDYPDKVKYLGVLSREEIMEFYDNVDCLISCSIDDPMPITVTEAWQKGIITICSEYTGQKKFIEDYNCGILYNNNDFNDLSDKIIRFTNNNYDLEQMRLNAKNVFDNYFSESVFNKNIKDICDLINKK